MHEGGLTRTKNKRLRFFAHCAMSHVLGQVQHGDSILERADLNQGKRRDGTDAQIDDIPRSPQIRFIGDPATDDHTLPFGNSDHLPGCCPPVTFNGHTDGFKSVWITPECTGVIHLEHCAVFYGGSDKCVLQVEW